MKKHLVLFLFFTMFSIYSCREKVDFNFSKFPEKPVVNAMLACDSIIKLHISLSGSINGIPLQVIDNAKIQIFVNNILSDTATSRSNGIYISKSISKAGNMYSCKISIPGYDSLTAKTIIPQKPILKKCQYDKFAGMDNEGVFYSSVALTIYSNDEPEYFYVRLSNVNFTNRYIKFDFFDDQVIQNEALPLPVFSNALFKNKERTIKLNFYNEENYPVVVELRKITEGYYNYMRSKYLYEQGRYPDFMKGMQAAEIVSNIENGYGNFLGYSIVYSDTISGRK